MTRAKAPAEAGSPPASRIRTADRTHETEDGSAADAGDAGSGAEAPDVAEAVAEAQGEAEAPGDTGAPIEARAAAGTAAGAALGPADAEWYEQPHRTDAEASADPALAPPPLTPAQAFDALYTSCAPTLVQQTYLLTGSCRQARDAVERAFQLAWQQWPEVAVDPDPAGWVRAMAHECALSPWHRLLPRLTGRFRGPEPEASEPSEPSGRALLAELQKLPSPYRRTLVLYDGLGLNLPETAAETEASTPATAGRVQYARTAVLAGLPEEVAPEELHRLLSESSADVRPRSTTPIALRTRADLRARRWIHAAVVFTSVLLTAIALTLRTAPDRYEPPVPPGAPVRGVPPKAVPGALSDAQLKLRAKLRAAQAAGPERLHPEAG